MVVKDEKEAQPHQSNDNIYCSGKIAFEDSKCQSCFNYNIHHQSNLKCQNMQNSITESSIILDRCMYAKNNNVCKVCHHFPWPYENYFDPMRRNGCRKQSEKCPIGKGFYKPDLNEVSSNI